MNKYELKEKLLSTDCFYDNEWLDKYINLLEERRCEESIKYVTQKHHKFPRHLSTLLNEEVDDSEENLVILKFKDHLLAHTYLLHAAKDSKEKQKSVLTLQCMMNKKILNRYKDDLLSLDLIEELENLKEDIDFCRSALDDWRLNNPEEYGKAQSRPGDKNGMWGYEWSEEDRKRQGEVFSSYMEENGPPMSNPDTVKKVSESLKGHEVSEEVRKKVSDFVSGSTNITNGKNNLRCDKNNVDYYAPLGYWRGCTQGLDKTVKKVDITNGFINHRILPEELELWESFGWKKKFKYS